jgi:hypothetical protein
MPFLSLKNDINVASKRNKQTDFEKKTNFGILKVSDENPKIAGSGVGT